MNSSPFNFYKCDICTFGTKSFQRFQNHSRSHEKKPPFRNLFDCESSTLEAYKCRNCNFETHLKTHLYTFEHLRETEQTSKTAKIFCNNCSMQTSSVLVFLGHRCRRRVEKPYSCDQCSYKGRLEHHLSIHKTFKHPNTSKRPTKWHTCPRCRYRTNLEADLHNHVVWKHGNLDQWFECDQCPYKGKMQHHVLIHKRLKHPTLRETPKSPELEWYECEQCSFRTRERAVLRSHVASKHRDKWYECDQCRFKSMTIPNLTYHRRVTHAGDVKWLECDRCPYKEREKL